MIIACDGGMIGAKDTFGSGQDITSLLAKGSCPISDGPIRLGHKHMYQ